MGHGWIYTLSIVSIFHLKDGQNFANFFTSFLAAEFMRHTLIPIIKTGREWTFLIPTFNLGHMDKYGFLQGVKHVTSNRF